MPACAAKSLPASPVRATCSATPPQPSKGVNFIVAHDGFTLADLVSYARKHNEANGELQPRRDRRQLFLEPRRRGAEQRSCDRRGPGARSAQSPDPASFGARNADAGDGVRARLLPGRQQQRLCDRRRDDGDRLEASRRGADPVREPSHPHPPRPSGAVAQRLPDRPAARGDGPCRRRMARRRWADVAVGLERSGRPRAGRRLRRAARRRRRPRRRGDEPLRSRRGAEPAGAARRHGLADAAGDGRPGLARTAARARRPLQARGARLPPPRRRRFSRRPARRPAERRHDRRARNRGRRRPRLAGHQRQADDRLARKPDRAPERARGRRGQRIRRARQFEERARRDAPAARAAVPDRTTGRDAGRARARRDGRLGGAPRPRGRERHGVASARRRRR